MKLDALHVNHKKFVAWNDKNLDYEIETVMRSLLRMESLWTWNDKNLDYEIETKRLLRWWERRIFPWNDKNLDYEIETFSWQCFGKTAWHVANLETTRTSITRLKQVKAVMGIPQSQEILKRQEPRLRDWNFANEGDTIDLTQYSWNDKNLDYEIETDALADNHLWAVDLKRQEPRLRDWNRGKINTFGSAFSLKRQEPRLRDWNNISLGFFE